MKNVFAWSKPCLFTLGFILVLLLGVIDTLTGEELSFSVFYMLPIYIVTWYIGRWQGITISIFSALTWLVADYLAGHVFSHGLIPVWNMFVRLSFFLLTAYLLSELQKHEQRRRALERIFFHDIINLVGSVRGFAELLKDREINATQEVYEMIYQAADKSLEEIEAQKTLTNAENNEINLELAEVDSQHLLNLVVNLYRHHNIAKGITIQIAGDKHSVLFESDQSILFRVLGNMLKNALEGTASGGQVTVGCRQDKNMVCFWTQNAAVIPPEIKKNIFKRTVSVKGESRGLGTYSMKILSNKLGGHLSFTSEASQGTVFTACYPLQFPQAQAPRHSR